MQSAKHKETKKTRILSFLTGLNLGQKHLQTVIHGPWSDSDFITSKNQNFDNTTNYFEPSWKKGPVLSGFYGKTFTGWSVF